MLDHIRGLGVIERTSLVLLDPDPNQVARDVVALRQAMQVSPARNSCAT